MTKEQEKEVYDCLIELRTELRSRGGLRDRVETLERVTADHKAIVVKGLTVIGTVTAIAAFAGSSAGAKILRIFVGS